MDKTFLEIIKNILANAEIVPDIRMNNSTEVYAVPLDDIENLRMKYNELKKNMGISA